MINPPSSKKLTRIVPVRLAEDDYLALKEKAKADDRPVSQWIRMVLRKAINGEKP